MDIYPIRKNCRKTKIALATAFFFLLPSTIKAEKNIIYQIEINSKIFQGIELLKVKLPDGQEIEIPVFGKKLPIITVIEENTVDLKLKLCYNHEVHFINNFPNGVNYKEIKSIPQFSSKKPSEIVDWIFTRPFPSYRSF